jgi:DNA gyrase subunit A
MIRMAAADLRVMGRATQGVRLINLKSGESIASVAKVPSSEVEEVIEGIEGGIAPEAGEASAE